MDISNFIKQYREAFGNAGLPLIFWYASSPISIPEKTQGCFIKDLRKARDGFPMSFNADSIACGGGKLYTGFSDVPPYVAHFVSEKEKYKKTPQMVMEEIEAMNINPQTDQFLCFSRIDKIEKFPDAEGLIFFATPDMLSGLVSWVYFDTTQPDAVSVPWGSGCSTIITSVVNENRKNGKRTFLGLFDPSVRPSVENNILSLAIPFSRFKELYDTMPLCCFNGTHAWAKVRERIEQASGSTDAKREQ